MHARTSVECSSTALESIDNIESGDSLSLGVFGIGDGVTNNTFQELFEDSTSFLIDQTTEDESELEQ